MLNPDVVLNPDVLPNDAVLLVVAWGRGMLVEVAASLEALGITSSALRPVAITVTLIVSSRELSNAAPQMIVASG